MNDFDFGNYLCGLREGRGLSQAQLAELLGVTDKAVSKWENGRAKPMPDGVWHEQDMLFKYKWHE